MTSTDFVRADPRGPYAGAVVSLVGYRQRDIEQRLHRGLPSPYLTFVVSLDNPVVVGEREDDPEPVSAYGMLGPLAARPAFIDQPSAQEGVQLAIHPFASRWLFGVPASRLTGLALDVRDVLGAPADALRARIGDTDDWGQRFAAVSGLLAERARTASGAAAARPRPEVVEGWRWIVARGGNGRIDDLAAHVALSPRRLRTVFVDELGFGPKVLSRLVRFERAVAMVRDQTVAPETGSLSDVAARAGYADHAHLVHEFRTLSGTTPTGWVEEERRNLQAGGHRNGAS
ncbi:helix-turn-helix domain-containing protein [Mumia sp. zg.B17]|uniref:helix-turn-helix domain-containing protein n=1 Tax=Mumia sp. zg.B17 TaxID=2855446 RepID=UPI001C6F133A|nr:helix-turn-helix domain-containing protein [Mumia sp. zg.B17]MBW9205907.1 helix-turn-helix domain-containing protein [Mumia sp. zg.B17]